MNKRVAQIEWGWLATEATVNASRFKHGELHHGLNPALVPGRSAGPSRELWLILLFLSPSNPFT
jgi:hypothetical protein